MIKKTFLILTFSSFVLMISASDYHDINQQTNGLDASLVTVKIANNNQDVYCNVHNRDFACWLDEGGFDHANRKHMAYFNLRLSWGAVLPDIKNKFDDREICEVVSLHISEFYKTTKDWSHDEIHKNEHPLSLTAQIVKNSPILLKNPIIKAYIQELQERERAGENPIIWHPDWIKLRYQKEKPRIKVDIDLSNIQEFEDSQPLHEVGSSNMIIVDMDGVPQKQLAVMQNYQKSLAILIGKQRRALTKIPKRDRSCCASTLYAMLPISAIKAGVNAAIKCIAGD